MTTKERAGLEEIRKALDESRIDDAQAKDFVDRIRGGLAEPERVTREEVEGVKARILERLRSWEQKEAERKTKTTSKYVN